MNIFQLFDKISSPTTPSEPISHIIVGLGNPGTKYENTRHNAGFMAVDTLAEKYNSPIKKIKFKSLISNTMINGKNCLLMKPSTFMNNSGQAVVEAMNFYKIPIENILVIYDDISLEPSKIRIRRKGSDGGHNGIKSIIYLTGSDAFPRIKIGVGKKPHMNYNLADWVLSDFTKDEIPLIKNACDDACKCIELIVSNQIDKAMNEFN
ncbi:MAG: aminoacyl-tRNA hydrolase [Clostridiales bacterium]|jgi:PTH1 family peptidyl-tRNA hydrolase|nr:aminoacyl-tRNA hydrolase [Clostridiales bacterium]